MDTWAVLALDSGHISHLPRSSWELMASFYEDTAFPPDICEVELRELVQAMWTARPHFLTIAQEAFAASGTAIGPRLPQESLEALEALTEVLCDGDSCPDLDASARRCASNGPAWTALRLADHRLDVEAWLQRGPTC